MAGPRLLVEISGDTKKLQRALQGSQSGLQKLGKVAGVAGAAIFAGLAVAAKVGFDELADSQKVMAQTEAVIKSTGAANVTAQHVNDLAQKLLEVSGVDDELIASSENVLLTFRHIRNEVGKGNDIFDQATLATLDFSTAMGLDLNAAALSVGKALNSPIRGLTKLERQGVTFTEKQKEMIIALVESGQTMKAQKLILAELTKEFGGSAAAAGTTLPAQLARAREAFADVAATLVSELLPAITSVLTHLATFINYLKENPKLAKAVVIGITALATALIAASVAQMALNLAVLANPYVAAVVGIIALGAAIGFLIKKFEFARKHWQLLMITIGLGPVLVATAVKAIIRHIDPIKGAFNAVRNVALQVFNAIKAAVSPLVTVLAARFNAMRTAAVRAFGFMASSARSVISAISTVVGWVQTLISWIGRIPRHISIDIDVPGGGPSLLDILGRQHGGPVTGRTPYIVGERGPELFVPRSSGNVIPNNRLRSGGMAGAAAGGGSVQVIVVGGDRSAIEWFRRLMDDHAGRNGGQRP